MRTREEIEGDVKWNIGLGEFRKTVEVILEVLLDIRDKLYTPIHHENTKNAGGPGISL